MPEGPEIRNQTMRLKSLILGERLSVIEDINVSNERRRTANIKRINKDIEENDGLKILSVESKGKKTIITLEEGWCLIFSYGLTGKFVIQEEVNNGYIRNNTQYFRQRMGIGSENYYFSDVCNFGRIIITNDKTKINDIIRSLGKDPLQEKVTYEYFLKEARKKSRRNLNIGKFLMNQNIIAGVGNMYKSESLYKAKIYPKANLSDLSDDDLINLLNKIVETLKQNYERLRTNKGHNLLVYERDKDSDGFEVKTIKVTDGRNTYYVPEVQTIGT